MVMINCHCIADVDFASAIDNGRALYLIGASLHSHFIADIDFVLTIDNLCSVSDVFWSTLIGFHSCHGQYVCSVFDWCWSSLIV